MFTVDGPGRKHLQPGTFLSWRRSSDEDALSIRGRASRRTIQAELSVERPFDGHAQNETTIGGFGSYVELLVCLEMDSYLKNGDDSLFQPGGVARCRQTSPVKPDVKLGKGSLSNLAGSNANVSTPTTMTIRGGVEHGGSHILVHEYPRTIDARLYGAPP